jgi:hypothetical protein
MIVVVYDEKKNILGAGNLHFVTLESKKKVPKIKLFAQNKLVIGTWFTYVPINKWNPNEWVPKKTKALYDEDEKLVDGITRWSD